MTSCATWGVFELQTVVCANSATSTEGLGGTGKVGADHKSVPEAWKPNNKVTQRRVGQRLSGNCTFKDIERISICDSGASDDVEVANYDDSRSAPNTISSWHEVVCGIVVTPFLYKITTIWAGSPRIKTTVVSGTETIDMDL